MVCLVAFASPIPKVASFCNVVAYPYAQREYYSFHTGCYPAKAAIWVYKDRSQGQQWLIAGRRATHKMISDVTLTNLANGLGVAAMLGIVLYHVVSVNGKRMAEEASR